MLIQKIISIPIKDVKLIIDDEYIIIEWCGDEIFQINHAFMTDKGFVKEIKRELEIYINNEESEEIKEKLIEIKQKL